MLFGNRGPQSLTARRRERFQPKPQALEERQLLSIDLGGVAPPNQPAIATAPFGVGLAGLEQAGAAGFSVSNVGDTNGDGFDDFVIGAPTGVNVNGQIQPGNGSNSRAFLVFGSRTVGGTTTDWLTLLNAGERLGDLGQLNNANQNNPISGTASTAFAGLTFQTTQSSSSQLGASTAALGDVNGDGFADFIIGAPGQRDLNGNNPGTGRAYVVYGSASLTTLTSSLIDFDNVGASGVSVLTLGSTIANSRVGRSVGRIGNFFASGSASPDIVVGAPNASIAGLSDNGAVYAIPGSIIAGGATGQFNLNSIGNGAGGAIIVGSVNSQELGFSVAGAGNVDGDLTGANVGIDDLLIGAPVSNGNSGQAFLLYGGNAIPGAGTSVGGINVITSDRIGGAGANPLVGATFQGTSTARTGFAVSSIGDYNADGFADIAIGSPNANNNTGQADIFYGQPATGSTLVGTIPVFSPPAGLPSLSLVGAIQGALAGYSLSLSGKVTPTSQGNDFLVGSPGLNGNQGAVYYFPANPFLVTGTQNLSTAESAPLSGTLITISSTANGAPAFLGSSVSGRLVATGQTTTADNDNKADFIIGAANWNATTTGRTGAGGAFVIEGEFLPVQTPIDNAIQTDIAVGSAPAGLPPFGTFVINATSPDALDIYVYSNNTISPPFRPATDIDPTTIVVNGVPYPTATIRTDIDRNDDGIPEAIVTISPRSRLDLNSTITSFQLTGRTLATSPNSNVPFRGIATISVSGGGGGGGGSVGTSAGLLPLGTIQPSSFTPQFGADNYVPPTYALSRLNYKAIPRAMAYQQYLPGKGWAARLRNFANPRSLSRVPDGTQNSLAGRLPLTLDKRVFTRSKYHKNQAIQFHHDIPVIPTNRQTERLQAKGLTTSPFHRKRML